VFIALKFSYLGSNYNGLVVQRNTDKTVENELFKALKRVCLIEDEFSCAYTRCGRTDKGVSALGNVCALLVREVKDRNYSVMLNHVLPPDIRVIAFALVPPHFDARFSCIFRQYKYFFLKDDMDLERMQRAADKLIGTHDFRNFCKKDEGLKLEEGEEQNFV